MRFAGPCAADQHDVALLLEELAAGELADEVSLTGVASKSNSSISLASGTLAMVICYLIERAFGAGLPNLIAGHLLITLPFVVRSVWATMVGTDASLEEAAMGMGATPFAAFRHVTLPMAAPGIVAGAILAFTYSFNDVTVSIFLTSPGVTTLPVQLMADMETSANAGPAAVSSLMIALMLLIFLAVVRVGGLKAFLQG